MTEQQEGAYVEMLRRILPTGMLRAFEDPAVTEIYKNPHETFLRFDHRAEGRIATGIEMGSEITEKALNAIASFNGVTLDEKNASLQGTMPKTFFNRARVQGFVSPAVLDPAFNIRKHSSVVIPLRRYLERGQLSGGHFEALLRAIDDHDNILIVGGTNSGKTTLMNAILGEITRRFPTERIGIIEDTMELQCGAPDTIQLRASEHMTMTALVRGMLRLSPNRVCVGEVRGREAKDLMNLWSTGHPGGVASCHATSAMVALERMDRMAQEANVPPQQKLVADSVQLVVVIRGSGDGRKVVELVRVRGLDERDRYIAYRIASDGSERQISAQLPDPSDIE